MSRLYQYLATKALGVAFSRRLGIAIPMVPMVPMAPGGKGMADLYDSSISNGAGWGPGWLWPLMRRPGLSQASRQKPVVHSGMDSDRFR